MPMKPVTVRRWEVVLLFVVLVAIAVGGAWLNDRHIDKNAAEIKVNAAKIAETRADARVAKARAELATELTIRQRETIKIVCAELASVKAQILATLRSSEGQAQQLVGRIPGYTQADADLAEKRLQEAIGRFRPRPCPPNIALKNP